jgi:hypothetical protein
MLQLNEDGSECARVSRCCAAPCALCAAQGDRVIAAMGSELHMFSLKDIEAVFAGEPLLRSCGARF